MAATQTTFGIVDRIGHANVVERFDGERCPVMNRAYANIAAALLIALSLAIAGSSAWREHRSSHPAAAGSAPSATATMAPPAAPTVGTIGSVDTPAAEAVVADTLQVTGWALDANGVAGVEVRVDGKPYAARYGIARPDVAAVKPGFPDSAASGFDFYGEFGALDPVRHAVTVVAIDRAGHETVLARKSLIPRRAMSLWSAMLDERRTAIKPFRFLMMTSGAALGGAAEAETTYTPYLSRTTAVGMAIPILYLRTTQGAANDWVFDPDFDLSRKCKDRVVVEDNLAGVMRYAIDKRLPVQFNLNGGIWADASCDIPEWDLNDHLEQDVDNCQWTQENIVYPDDYRQGLPGSTHSPELARSLTYNVYATKVRDYKRRNLQAAARLVANFAHEHPDLFVGINLDADTYMNPFVSNGKFYDYNPGMLRQFRHWLAGSGPYAGKPEAGAPDLTAYRRKNPLTLAQVNRLAKQHWRSWDEVDPPRKFVGVDRKSLPAGKVPFWLDPWYLEWDAFRKHVVGLHYSELSEWAHEAGIPADRIFSAQAFMAPDAGLKPMSIHVQDPGPDYDSAGVSIEGAIPSAGHLGVILYGPAVANEEWLADGHSLFATFARMDPGWAIVEMNATDLKIPLQRPHYARSYRAFSNMFNFDAQAVSLMAWNGSNGLYTELPGYLPYTSWRNTPSEAAMRDFMVTHADLPRGARLWTFGAPGYADDDGWRLEQGKVYARGGYLDLEVSQSTATLLSPTDQVIRPSDIDSLILGLRNPTGFAAVQVFARSGHSAAWTAVGNPVPASTLRSWPAGLQMPLAWPGAWRRNATIVTELKIVLAFDEGTPTVRLDRIALYPAIGAVDYAARVAGR